MDNLLQFVTDMLFDGGYIMIFALYSIGEIVKGTETIDSRFIPPIILAVSLVLTPLVIGGYTPDNIVQAIAVTGVTVFFYEGYKETIKGE